jgi:DNA-binding response OmpR family regulator
MQTQAPAIILIEKDELTLELYQRELSKSFTVFPFTEICDVLTTLANRDIKAVVIEPEIDSARGWELIRSIQEAYQDRSIPVIVCSTRDSNNTGLARKVTKYLTKPVLPKTLREEILKVLGIKDELRKFS